MKLLVTLTILGLTHVSCGHTVNKRSFFSWSNENSPETSIPGYLPILKVNKYNGVHITPVSGQPIYYSLDSNKVPPLTEEAVPELEPEQVRQLKFLKSVAEILPDDQKLQDLDFTYLLPYADLVTIDAIERLQHSVEITKPEPKSKLSKLLSFLKWIKDLKLKPFKILANTLSNLKQKKNKITEDLLNRIHGLAVTYGLPVASVSPSIPVIAAEEPIPPSINVPYVYGLPPYPINQPFHSAVPNLPAQIQYNVPSVPNEFPSYGYYTPSFPADVHNAYSTHLPSVPPTAVSFSTSGSSEKYAGFPQKAVNAFGNFNIQKPSVSTTTENLILQPSSESQKFNQNLQDYFFDYNGIASNQFPQSSFGILNTYQNVPATNYGHQIAFPANAFLNHQTDLSVSASENVERRESTVFEDEGSNVERELLKVNTPSSTEVDHSSMSEHPSIHSTPSVYLPKRTNLRAATQKSPIFVPENHAGNENKDFEPTAANIESESNSSINTKTTKRTGTAIKVISSLGIAFGRPELPVTGFGNNGLQLDSYAAPISNGGNYNSGPAPQYGVPQQQPVIHKHVYVHVPPPEPTFYAPKKPQTPPPPPQKHYKIVFIKAPTPPPPQIPDIPNIAPPPEQKTLIYVLVKKPEEAPEITIPTPSPTPPSKPEVYFIRYKTQKQEGYPNSIAPEYGPPSSGSPSAPAPPSDSYGPAQQPSPSYPSGGGSSGPY